MELRHLRYFLAVAEELHFGRAAARLGIAQPPLSQQIRQLEEELGTALLVRARPLALTEPGRVLLAEARGILQRVARVKPAVERAARGETGSLAVGVVASATYGVFPRMFRRFRTRHPEVALTLAVMSSGEQAAALRAGQIQLGIARPPFGDETLRVETLLEEPVVVALPGGHPLAARSALRLRALADEPFVLFPRDRHPGWSDFVQGLCREAGFQPRIAQEATELAAAMALVAAGEGVTLVPASVQDLRRTGVAYRALTPSPQTPLVALYRPEPEVLPVIPRFLSVAREVLARPGRPSAGTAGPRRTR